MVLFQLLRCQRYLWRGLRDRAHVSRILYGLEPLPADVATAVVPAQALRNVTAMVAARAATNTASGNNSSPSTGTYVRGVIWPWYRRLPADAAFGQLIAQPITTSVYCGVRMVDELGHVNNAKYLEIGEFGRWHQLGFLGIINVMMERKVVCVLSDLSITYQREIAPCNRVWVRTRFLLPPEAAVAASEGAVGDSSKAKPPAVADKKRFFIEQEIWSADGQKLHAALTLAAALVGPVEYEKELHERYGASTPTQGGAAASSGGAKSARPRTTLNCEQVLAHAAGCASTAEVRRLFASAEHVRSTPVDAAAASPAPPLQRSTPDDTERADRMRMLAHVWKTSRDLLRRKSLITGPRQDKETRPTDGTR